MSASRLASRLTLARQRRFVGREAERDLFQSALAAPDLPFAILYVYGPGGIGKTTLLGEFLLAAERAAVPPVVLDGRDIESTPRAFLEALRSALGVPAPASPIEALAQREQRQVLLIDTYEALAPLDDWIREALIPQLPEQTLIVLASSYPPAAPWRADPGWQALVRSTPLRNLSPEESRAYLANRGVPEERYASILAFTHGHPLALSLVADVYAQRPDAPFSPETEPDIIRALLERLVQKTLEPIQRAALEVCALARLTTEQLLAETLDIADAHDLFTWLRGLSFIEAMPQGLLLHDLAREALIADLRWRNPERYADLHARARAYYATRLQQTQGAEQQRLLLDYIFLHRDSPVLRQRLGSVSLREVARVHQDALREDDIPAVSAMVERHEGSEAAEHARHWIERQRSGASVFRDATHAPVGYLHMVALEAATLEEIASDPATAATSAYLARHAPLRPGDRATLIRFWMAADTHQALSHLQALIGVATIRYYLTTSRLAYSFFPCAEPDLWAPLLTYADLERTPEADFAVGERRYGVFGHNWRAVPPMTWLARLAEREMGREVQPPDVSETAPVVALSQQEFTAAVASALRDLTRPDRLRGNPLTQSRLVMSRSPQGTEAGASERAATLATLVREAAATLQASPRDLKLYRALYHTYLQPAATQEQAAELLDLPFSTYRRHLKAGIKRLTEILWQWELDADEV
jgi:hypothetical protein